MKVFNCILSSVLGLILTVTLIVLGGIITLQNTILNSDFVISEMEKLNVYSIIIDQVKLQLKDQFPTEVPYVEEIIDETIIELEPWFNEQANFIICEGLAYIKGEQDLHIVIPLTEARGIILENVEEAIQEFLLPELEALPPDMVQLLLSGIYTEIDQQIPEQIEIDEALLGTDIVSQLHQLRQAVGYIIMGDKILFGLMAILILFISLLQRWQLKSIAIYTGIAFITAGAFTLIATLITGSFIPKLLPLELPADIISILPAVASDLSSPLRIYGIIILITGIALTLLYIKLKAEDYQG
jgi:hypothetical protein